MGDLCMLNGLEVGEYKNYIELCKALGWSIKTGNSKIAQLRQLSSVCKWHKQGNKIVVTEIYAEPKFKTDGRVNNGGNSTSKYMETIDILKNTLQEGQNICTFNSLCRLVGLVNNNFSIIEETKKISNYLCISIITVEDFVNSTKTKARSILETSLNNLQKQKVLSWCYTYNLKTINSKGNFVWNIATNKEIQKIQQATKIVLADMNYNNVQDVYMHKKYKRFCNKLNAELQKQSICISCYRCYNINVFSNNNNNINTNTLIQNINNKFLDSCIKSLENRINSNNTNTWGTLNPSTIQYKKDSLKLIDTFIKIGAKDIIESIKKVEEYYIY